MSEDSQDKIVPWYKDGGEVRAEDPLDYFFVNQAIPINLAVLVSGSGTTLQNLIDQITASRLDARIGLVIASRPRIAGIERAVKAHLNCTVIDRQQFPDVQSFSQEVFANCDAAGVELVCLGGWLCLLDVPPEYAGRVMNIHPALLPSFGGLGMYGKNVHRAVLDHGCKISGCTVHFLDNQYDNGPIILQRPCPVQENDSVDDLAHRVFEEEKIAYPHAIRLFQQKRLVIQGRTVSVLEAEGG